MLSVDTCCFETRDEYVKLNLSKFDEVTRQTSEGQQRTYFEVKSVFPGLNKVVYMPETGAVTFDISGKILPEQHRQLITQANIEQVFECINGTGVVKADMLSVLENSIVRRIDFTNNVEVGNVSEYMQAVALISSPKYSKDVYRGKGTEAGKTGVVFRGRYRTFKEHLLFYDKQEETGNSIYAGVLRVESKRSNFDAIRKDVEADNNLIDILTSTQKPVLKVYGRITGMNEANVKIYDSMRYINEIKELYYETLIQAAGGDMDTLRQYLILANKGKRRGNVTEHYKRIEAYKRMKDIDAGYTAHDYLQDIYEKLSA